MSPEGRSVFGNRSLEIINGWIYEQDPASQILKIIKLFK
jgi:hypothetical protein